jgi:hypothetical protein
MDERIEWLLSSDEPWTRYRTLIDLLERPEGSDEAQGARRAMLEHPQIRHLIKDVACWPGYALKRHNDAKHPLYKFSTLADFGFNFHDPGMKQAVDRVLHHQSPEGAFETLVFIPRTFGGSEQDQWSWFLCDSPTLLYTVIAMGLGNLPSVHKAVDQLCGLVEDNGWRCVVSPELGGFRGPGRKSDPCPIANVFALKALSLVPELLDSPSTRIGTEMLLRHWQLRREKKYYLFGMGTDFRKLKYPFVWYDILHVLDVLSHFPFVHTDPRFLELVDEVTNQADANGRYISSSMYLAWKDWSFADKKIASPWLTFLVLRIQKRTGVSFYLD